MPPRHLASLLLTLLCASPGCAPAPPPPLTEQAQLERRAKQVGREAEGDQIAAMLELAEARLADSPMDALRITMRLGQALQRSGIALDILKAAFLLERAVEIAEDSSADPDDRAIAIAVLGCTSWSHHASTLLPLTAARHPVVVQEAAIHTLDLMDAGEFAEEMIARWPTLSAAGRARALSSLVSLRPRVQRLLTALEEGSIRPGELSARHIFDLRAFPDDKIRARVARLFP